ncbi:MAG: hypothetical protein KGS45_01285 [Planctomycetes bacterium]|nr:hypothetical protein [Planctomycetota bacterium]
MSKNNLITKHVIGGFAICVIILIITGCSRKSGPWYVTKQGRLNLGEVKLFRSECEIAVGASTGLSESRKLQLPHGAKVRQDQIEAKVKGNADAWECVILNGEVSDESVRKAKDILAALGTRYSRELAIGKLHFDEISVNLEKSSEHKVEPGAPGDLVMLMEKWLNETKRVVDLME